MTDLNKVMTNTFTKKRWVNVSKYCNRKTHPLLFPYRPYRRGKNRCTKCGAKIEKIRCIRKSSREMLVDNLFTESPLLKMLKKK